MSLSRPLRYSMIGGGPGAFIGAVHRRAAALDGLATLVAGVFSSDVDRSRAHAATLGVPSDRVYASFDEMAEREAARADGIQFVVVVTPNHLHYAAARPFVERGVHVVCDKPLATALADAESLCRLAAERDVVFAVTHAYAGYPMVKQARALVRQGALGTIRKVVADYSQGWLATPVETTGVAGAEWRTDPARAGAGALGDIGTHAEHLARYVSGLSLTRLHADVSTFVPGRRVDDDANILVHYEGGAKGMLSCTQIAAGEENRLTLRVHGTEGSLAWAHDEPNVLTVRYADKPVAVYTPGHPFLAPEAQRASRMPNGHPEGLLEAFANVYGNALRTIACRISGREPDAIDLDFPTVQDGAIGVHFIERALASGRSSAWVDARYTPPGR